MSLHLHHVCHSGASQKYYLGILKYFKDHSKYDISVTITSLREFIDNGCPKGTDVLSYQTFPDEFNKKKFSSKVICESDQRFYTFSGRKILIDIHDCGDTDAFSRMANGRDIPRVKCFPSTWFLRNYNVILLSTVSANPEALPNKYDRIITISCKFKRRENGYYRHNIRNSVIKYLRESFSQDTNFAWVGNRSEYFQELRRTNIVIGAPGWGRHNASYWGAMKAGALLFAHRTLNDVKLFPHVDLIDGDDFISYDLFNFKMKLERVLQCPEEIERVRNNGREKFAKGLNYKKSADQFVTFLREG